MWNNLFYIHFFEKMLYFVSHVILVLQVIIHYMTTVKHDSFFWFDVGCAYTGRTVVGEFTARYTCSLVWYPWFEKRKYFHRILCHVDSEWLFSPVTLVFDENKTNSLPHPHPSSISVWNSHFFRHKKQKPGPPRTSEDEFSNWSIKCNHTTLGVNIRVEY